MACYNVNPYTCTYDSGGAGSLPGGGNPDYSSLTTWESDSDNDLSGYVSPVILNCYDSQEHIDKITFYGASNTSTSVYRHLTSSPSCVIPFSARAGEGANFYYSTSSTSEYLFYCTAGLVEYYSRVSKVCGSYESTYSGAGTPSAVMVDHNGRLACVVIHDITSASTAITAINVSEGLAFNCIVYSVTGVVNKNATGLVMTSDGVCAHSTVIDVVTSGTGLGRGLSNGTSSAIAWSNYAADCSYYDFSENIYWNTLSGWNASKDTTADLSGRAGDNYKNSLNLLDTELDADYLPTTSSGLYGAGGAGNNYGRNIYNDVTASNDCYDFFKNDTNGDDLSKHDIRGVDRPDADTADVSWAVGAAEYLDESTTAVVPTSLAPTSLATSEAPTSLATSEAPTTFLTTSPPTTLAPTTFLTTGAPTTLPSTAAPTTAFDDSIITPMIYNRSLIEEEVSGDSRMG